MALPDKSYQSALADRGLVQSMSRKGNCLDNAVMENFFGHLKEEMYYRRDYRNVEELENAVNEYITYWNQKRIKLSLGGLSPVEYRTEYQKAGLTETVQVLGFSSCSSYQAYQR